MRYLKKYNEELKSDTYKSAADKLAKLGHVKRPEELMKWHDIAKEKEEIAKEEARLKAEEERLKAEEESKRKTLEEASKLGTYQLYLGYRHGGRTYDYKGDFYINLAFESWNLDENYYEWKEGQTGLWLHFSFGVIPVNEDGKEFCKNIVDPIIGVGSDKITRWLGSFWLNISRAINPDNEELILHPEGKGYFEEHDGEWYLTNRSSAMRFKDTLYKIFSGDIVVRETQGIPGGMKEQIIDELCNERTHGINEYEDIMNSIKSIRINNLYKD